MTIAVVVLVVVLVLIGLDWFAGRIIRVSPQPVERTVPELGFAFEDLRIQSGDHELAAWLIQPPEAQPFEPLILVAHGWSANYSTVLALAEPLAQTGHEVLLFDVRGHGRNGPQPYVSVRAFRDDLIAVTRYAATRFPDRQLVVVGHSMGGSAGVLAAAEGAPIDGLVLVAAPSDILKVTAEFFVDQGLPGHLLVSLLGPFWWRRVGSTFRPLTPRRRIRELDIPLLLIHPEHDRRVVREHADELAEAAGMEYRLIPDREHTDVLGDPLTLRFVLEFLEDV
ncbi:MAG: alpha/beta fold hydrolase [Gemmatimonadota bacterium]|nr:alpha/beta fold hydrolase [Gemmatimonadota bacterium]MDE3007262.1 alpha/beta fold hydrolase [Gemmatimonadota bacterium]MDE3015028.1 alpha/beta fold hydrolase [Gemmatimonadota bacterium]